ncbi:methylated-DNA--[protein]-cysteine S-methyltransferase [Robiginitalea sp. M366]|uniref:methylated-DNA--[protein]-cysteine S-methyltransferase n=1 Tax=Robiginitalea aestuariiviva TaxID=3036903 RepID=UPI00240E8DD4|nr:methylated-DNA--[protein]-cysteine S-methyltransferase [Robiginitalea aestuariiviva]MDG1571372.1 methylated-DNA--[protein]-cysteine S-methyltransferase [Robiginitalea aestuariiviva]
MEEARIQTPLGIAVIRGNQDGVSAISVEDGTLKQERIPETLQVPCAQLKAYFEGELTQFDFPMQPEGTPFQKRVWQALEAIPYGQTVSYQELTLRLGDPKAIRAVAAANGKNPLWIVVPCHRVIGSDGSMTGYAGGIHRKKWLLNHESPTPQHSLFG